MVDLVLPEPYPIRSPLVDPIDHIRPCPDLIATLNLLDDIRPQEGRTKGRLQFNLPQVLNRIPNRIQHPWLNTELCNQLLERRTLLQLTNPLWREPHPHRHHVHRESRCEQPRAMLMPFRQYHHRRWSRIPLSETHPSASRPSSASHLHPLTLVLVLVLP